MCVTLQAKGKMKIGQRKYERKMLGGKLRNVVEIEISTTCRRLIIHTLKNYIKYALK